MTFKPPSFGFKPPSFSFHFQGFTPAMKATVDRQELVIHRLMNLIPIFAETEPGYPQHKVEAEKKLTDFLNDFLAGPRDGRPLDNHYRNQMIEFFKALKPLRYSPAEGSALEKLMVEALEACKINLVNLNS